MAGESRPSNTTQAFSQMEHQSDNEPLIDGEARGFTSRVKHAFTGWFKSFRNDDTQPSEQPSSSASSQHSEVHDIETGSSSLERESSAQSLTTENREARCSEIEGGSPGRLRRHASAQSLASRSPRRSSDSQDSSNTGLLNNLWRLGEAAIPQPQRNSTVNATCLICLESLSPEEFASGEAIVLDCECRGDVAMRHRSCVEKWTHVKGNRTCDICKTLIKNLPDPPPRAPEAGNGHDDGEMLRNNAQYIVEQAPTGTDVVFDCIRVTWIAMIISILFFGMDIANALWTGAIIGLGYTICVRAMYQYQLRMIMREQQRERDVEEVQVQGQAHAVVL